MTADRDKTIRQEIAALLEEGPVTARDISQSLGIREKEALSHLPFIEKTLVHKNRRLCLDPYRCQACDFEFTERKRFSKPGRCPACKGERIEPAVFWIEIDPSLS